MGVECIKVDGGIVKMAKTLALQARGWGSIPHVPTKARHRGNCGKALSMELNIEVKCIISPLAVDFR